MRSTILTMFALIFLVADLSIFKVHAEELNALEQFQKALSITDDVKRYERLVELYLGATRHYVVTYPSSTPWVKLRTVVFGSEP